MRATSPWDGSAIRQVGDTPGLVVVAGGRASRFGADKLSVDLGGLPLVGHVLRGARAALPPGTPIVAVGPEPDGGGWGREVLWVREDPPLGGPVAALAAGLSAVPGSARVLLVASGDSPFSATALPRLAQAVTHPHLGDQGSPLSLLPGAEVDGAVAVDPTGRRQPLLAAFRVEALRAAIGEAPGDRSMRSVLATLVLIDVQVTSREAFDVDHVGDIATARAWLRENQPEPDPVRQA